MTTIVRPKLGLFLAGAGSLAVLVFGALVALPSALTTQNTQAAALLQFTNPYGAAVTAPDVAGDWMVFVDHRDSSRAHLYTHNFTSNQEKMISWDLPKIDAAFVQPKISEGLVVFTNKEHGKYVMHYFNPFMYRDTIVANSKLPVSHPDFDKRNIIWTAQTDPEKPEVTQVFWYDADRRVKEQLTSSEIAKHSAVVNGDVAYWLEANGENWDVIRYDLDHAARKTLLADQPIIGTISASANTVAYSKTSLEGVGDIFVYNVITGKETQVTETGTAEDSPVIYGNYIAYNKHVSGADAEIALYDRTAKTQTMLSNDELDHGVVSLTNARLAWADARTGKSQIYFYDFASTDTRLSNDLSANIAVHLGESGDTVFAVPSTEELAPDTDGDGLSDEMERNHYRTSVTRPDTDGDGLSDYDELFVYYTIPTLFDSDEDGYGDGTEVKTNHDPLSHAGKDSFYGLSRMDPAIEQVKAVQLKAALESKLGKGNVGIHKSQWLFYVNAYIYGGYTVDEIIKSSRGEYGVISTDIPANEWRNTALYSNAISA